MRIAINGFGRIGRCVFRLACDLPGVDVIAINARHDAKTLAHLVQYDSVHGSFQHKVTAQEGIIEVENKKEVKVVNYGNPAACPWDKLNIDVVIDCTGAFRTVEGASGHLAAGAKQVVVSAPAKDDMKTIVMGVNEEDYDGETVVSNASCTTNALAPIVQALDEAFDIETGMMTTIHSYTNDQNNLDNPHKDLRRARSCGMSMIPTSTGAAKTIGKILPHLNGKLDGLAVRVPTPNVSLIDFVCDVNRMATTKDVNLALSAYANEKNGILDVCHAPLVSIDYTTNSYSCVIDALSTTVIAGKKIKVIAWYDNEWGYSSRLLELAAFIHAKAK